MRIAGTEIPTEKRIEAALPYIFGVGPARARDILRETGISPDTRTKDLTEKEAVELRKAVEKYRVEGDLRREISSNIKRLKEIKCYRGSRHTRKLPSRGQRTKTNSRTLRGNVRVTMGSGKRKLEKK